MSLPDWMQTTTTWDIGPDDTDAPLELPQVRQPVMDRLEAWAEQMQADIALADAKAATLLGWAGTALAVVSTVIASVGVYVPPTHRWVAVVGLCGLTCLAWSVVALVLVIRPRLGGRLWGGYTYYRDQRSFLTFASLTPEDLVSAACADTYAQADPTQAVNRVQILAGIALAKHQLIRTACTVLLLSMPLLAVAGAAMGFSMSGGA